MAEVLLRGATKRFDGRVAVDHLDIDVADGELLVLLGPSGCGTTTALRMVAGLEEPDEGEIELGGQVVNDVDPKDRDVAMVFQSYALYPHLSVRKNIEFPLRSQRMPTEERELRVKGVAGSLQLEELLERKPRQLSGGQRQRVALARAIVRQPKAFLMDEPLSNLDARLRVEMRAELVELHRRSGTTIIYVTHDQVEAMTMGDRVAVLRDGVLQQVGTPKQVHARPANLFVASFIGSPPMNLFPGSFLEDPGVTLGVRPEGFAISADGPLRAVVTLVESLGHEHHVACRIGGAEGSLVIVRLPAAVAPPEIGEQVGLRVIDRVFRFDPESGRLLEAR